ncbi:hypothetical protein [Paraburkholderia silvatlantica]|uniref:Uncharacterized protein n=1 Tax=Paraburkholderia silvatlantica TaxID=321895 RepID=A0ABR6G1S1_9BURK|nr:hypothetical protein [Paraburkholderia silvatlantica]MBB2932955.1 hypothetical protein [Paraburkholderia silvatlantica]PVY15516.1 hypothetical protein C7411_1552 [Paraburkholderia silvatlantica]PXW23016.1 hypothetical protein C7413_1592 [Paraburkholderia silvatlantica]
MANDPQTGTMLERPLYRWKPPLKVRAIEGQLWVEFRRPRRVAVGHKWAQSFYVQRGFQTDGTAKVIESGGALTEMRLKGRIAV